MKRPTRVAVTLVRGAVAGAVLACARDPELPPLDSAAHQVAWEAWKLSRTTFLTTPGRPLSYTGLRWLSAGPNTIGADSSSRITLAGRGVSPRVGTLVRDGAVVRFEPAANARVLVDSQPATAVAALRTDADSGGASRVDVGSAGFRIIKRLDSLGVRSWDTEHPALRTFRGLEYFPLDAKWRIAASFVPLPQPRKESVMTEAGVMEEHEVVGAIRATIDGAPYELTALAGTGPTDLFIVFTDATSGDQTYGFRFLHAARDSVTNTAVLDFNFAYSPDCAFTPYATCPLPPAENRIRAPVPAGERRYAHDVE